MKLLKKFVTMCLYAFLLLPGRDFRVDSGLLRAVEIASTALDRTMRRRKGSVENARFARHARLTASRRDFGDQTLTLRLRTT